MKIPVITAEAQVPASTGVGKGLPGSTFVTGGLHVPSVRNRLPEQLPLSAIHPDAFSAPYRAIGEAGATVAKLGTGVMELLGNAAAARKQAEDKMQVLRLHLGAVKEVDALDTNLRADTSLTPDGHDPYLDNLSSGLDAIQQKYMKQATPEQGVMLEEKLIALQVTKRGTGSTHALSRFVNRQEELATVSQATHLQQALSAPWTQQGNEQFRLSVAQGLDTLDSLQALAPDRRATMKKHFMDSAYGERARQDMLREPEGFAQRADSYKHVVDPKMLTTLREQSVDEARKRREWAYTDTKRADDARKENEGQVAKREYFDLLRRLDPVLGPTQQVGASRRPAVTSEEIETIVSAYSDYLSPEMVSHLRRAYTDPIQSGGLSDPALKNSMAIDVLRGHVGLDAILTSGLNAPDTRELVNLHREMEEKQDIYGSHEFSLGRSIITTAVAPELSGIPGLIQKETTGGDGGARLSAALLSYAKQAARIPKADRFKLLDLANTIASQFAAKTKPASK